MAIDITTWGIDVNNTPKENTDYWNDNIQAGQEVYLPADPGGNPYMFNKIKIVGIDNVEFYGKPNSGNLPVIKFNGGKLHNHLKIKNADNFNIYDLIFDGSNADYEGGVWARDGATNGTLKNLTVYDAHGVSLVVGDKEKNNPAHDIVVEDCTVYAQRKWDANDKAMILAGGYAHDITFKNCTTYSVNPNNSNFYSPADHFDTDNATNVEYRNCTADGSGTVNNSQNRKGIGFWNEAGTQSDHLASSTYYDCTAIQTGGGLGATQNSTAIAHRFNFDACSHNGWAAWSHGNEVSLEIYNSTLDGCYSEGGYLEGGVHFGAGEGVVEDCIFENTSSKGYNVSFYTSNPNGSVDVTLENNTFDQGARSHGISKESGTIELIDNDLSPDASYLKDGDYNWIFTTASKDSATTTAVNTPTSSTSVSVEYQSHFTSVQYNNGEAIDWMLDKMRDAINADTDAYITADVNMSDNTITFTQEDASSPDNLVSIYVNSSDWANGNPFDPMDPAMI